jgi:tripeptide aminopeptidase
MTNEDRTVAVLRDTDETTLAHMMEVTRIPAPGGAEAARGRWLAERLRELDLVPVTDDVGNVRAVSPAARPEAACVVVAAHLDTVFDADTPLDIRRDGTRLHGPGISDNGRGLAGMLALARALRAGGWPVGRPILLAGTVGEEGAGDLRGARHLVEQEGHRMMAFIALDGAGCGRVVNTGVGSRRLRITFSGPGGHSWSDWGEPNAIHAAGRAITALADLRLPVRPRTTLNVGRITGGTSVNAIPADAAFEVDLRSEEAAPLMGLEARVRDAIESARRGECRDGAALDCRIDVFGDRPAGRTDEDHPLVRSAIAAAAAAGCQTELASSSTDANVAMAAGIPAIAIGAGGDAGGMHTISEWYDNRGGPAGLEAALRVLLGAAA